MSGEGTSQLGGPEGLQMAALEVLGFAVQPGLFCKGSNILDVES